MSLFVLTAIYLLGSTKGLCIWWVHIFAAIFALLNIHRFSKFYLFWIMLAVAVLYASEPRFSLEYLILALGFAGTAYSPWWQNKSKEDKRNFLAIAFLSLLTTYFSKKVFYERGSLLLWLPVFFALYFNEKTQKNSIINFALAPVIFLFNKKTTIVAYITNLVVYMRSRLFLLIGALMMITAFVYKTNIVKFFKKSFQSRLYIWASSFKGALAEPLFGHGFGTFTIDFPPHRIIDKAIFGARAQQQVAHGHNLFAHVAFEQGLLGLIVLGLIFYLIYKNAKPAFLPLLVISFLDASIVSFSQYLLAALLLVPFLKTEREYLFTKKIPEKLFVPAKLLTYLVAGLVLVSSCVGHFYYANNQLSKAVSWDRLNSLYYFMRGANRLNKDTVKSEKDFKAAIELSENVGYFHAFYAASLLANLKFEEAKQPIKKALDLSGGDAYWYLLSALINHEDKDLYKQHLGKALKKRPEIKELISNPNFTASEFIGGRHSDVRVSSFYRKGPRVFLPLPVMPELPNI